MKRRKVGILGVILGLLALGTLHADAVGLGFYGEGGIGRQTWEADDDFSTEEFDTDSSQGEFGFLLDTAVASSSLFNYRLAVGYEALRYEDDDGQKLDMDMFVLDNTFGFGVVRAKSVRLWLGPELRIFGGSGDSDYGDSVDLWGAGIGASIGVNIHMGPVVSFTCSGSGLYTYAYGENQDNDDLTYTVDGFHAYARVGLLFRIDDHHE